MENHGARNEGTTVTGLNRREPRKFEVSAPTTPNDPTNRPDNYKEAALNCLKNGICTIDESMNLKPDVLKDLQAFILRKMPDGKLPVETRVKPDQVAVLLKGAEKATVFTYIDGNMVSSKYPPMNVADFISFVESNV